MVISNYHWMNSASWVVISTCSAPLVQTGEQFLTVWPWPLTLTYNPRLAKVKVAPRAKKSRSRSNGSNRRAPTDKRTDTHTDATKRIISPATRSINIICQSRQLVVQTLSAFNCDPAGNTVFYNTKTHCTNELPHSMYSVWLVHTVLKFRRFSSNVRQYRAFNSPHANTLDFNITKGVIITQTFCPVGSYVKPFNTKCSIFSCLPVILINFKVLCRLQSLSNEMFCSCKISTDKRVARSLCHSRACTSYFRSSQTAVIRPSSLSATLRHLLCFYRSYFVEIMHHG